MSSRGNPDERGKKLFIGGLHLKTDEAGLGEYFGQYGELTDVVVMKDKITSRSRGFGFVTYATLESINEALKHRPHTIDGKEVDAKRAMPKNESTPENHATVKKLFVGKINESITEDELKEYFSQYGTINECIIVTDKATNKRKTFGFIVFEDADSVDQIVLSTPHIVNGFQLETKKPQIKDQNGRSNPRSNSGGMHGGAGMRNGAGGDNSYYGGMGGGYDAYGGGSADYYGVQSDYYGGSGYGADPNYGYSANSSGYMDSSYNYPPTSSQAGGYYGGMNQSGGGGYDHQYGDYQQQQFTPPSGGRGGRGGGRGRGSKPGYRGGPSGGSGGPMREGGASGQFRGGPRAKPY